MHPSGIEDYGEGWEFPADLPPCSFYMFVINWDERRGLFFIRENDEWTRFVPDGFR